MRKTFRQAVLAALVCASCAFSGSLPAAERVSFPSLDRELTKGEPTLLGGLLFRPQGEGPFPAIVGLHGCAGLFDRQGNINLRDGTWANFLAERGYLVLLVDSFGPRGVTNQCAGSYAVLPSRERPYDAYGALMYLRSLPDVRGDRIGLIGWSHGGGSLLYTVDARAPARAAAGGADFRAAVVFYPGTCNVQEHPDWSSTIPLLFLHGAIDNWTRVAPCSYLVDRAKQKGTPAEMVVYPNSFHDFDWPDLQQRMVSVRGNPTIAGNPAALEDARKRVPEFFDRHLK